MRDIAKHLADHPDHQGHDWGQWEDPVVLEEMSTEDLHALAHSATAFMEHFSDDLSVPYCRHGVKVSSAICRRFHKEELEQT